MAPPPRSSNWGSPEAPKLPCFPHALALVCAACLAARQPSRRALLRCAAGRRTDEWMVPRAGLYSGFDATCLDMAHEHALYQQQVHTRTRTHARTHAHAHTHTLALARARTHAVPDVCASGGPAGPRRDASARARRPLPPVRRPRVLFVSTQSTT